MPNPVTGPYGPQKQDGKVSVNGTDNSCGWIFGANWLPTDSLSFGYTHRSELKHDIRGTATIDVPGTAALLTTAGAYQTGPAGPNLTLPRIHPHTPPREATSSLALSYDAHPPP